MPANTEFVQALMSETARQVVAEIDAEIVEAIAAGDEATPEQQALMRFLFETPKGEDNAGTGQR